MTRKISAGLAFLTVMLLTQSAFAQGFIVQKHIGHPIIRPPRPRPIPRPAPARWTIRYHHADIKVRDQIATVSIDQKFENIGAGMIEAQYYFPVPEGSAIKSMTLLVDGKEFKAKLYTAKEARSIYENIVRQKKDPALLEYVGYGLFKTSAFPLMPGKPARIQIVYKTICKRDADIVEVFYPLTSSKFSAKPIEKIRITADIKSSKGEIQAAYSPVHDLDVKRKANNHIIATWKQKNTIPTNDFMMFYSYVGNDVQASMITHQPDSKKDGYFLLMLQPTHLRKMLEANKKLQTKKLADNIGKDIVFVLDISGSMTGKKIKQAKGALKFALSRLGKNDCFNIVVYSDEVKRFYPHLKTATEANKKKALEDLDRIEAGGSTNIEGALKLAMNSFSVAPDTQHPAKTPCYMVFLTDGLPTAGDCSEKGILKACKTANKKKVRLFTFGVGFDVNVRLLDKLTIENRGKSDYVKPNENIERPIARLVTKIQNPVLTNIKISIENVKLSKVYPRQLPDLFKNDQIVIAGRYDARELKNTELLPDGGRPATVVVTGDYMGLTTTFKYTVSIKHNRDRIGFEFVDSIWAIRRVGYLMDQVQVEGKVNKEIVNEIVQISTKYGIITPYTSFLADERNVYRAVDSKRSLERLHFSMKKAKKQAKTGGMAQNSGKMRSELNDAAKPMMKSLNRPGSKGARQWGNSDTTKYLKNDKESIQTVRNFGNMSAYRTGNTWVASNARDLDLQKDKAKIQNIEIYSKRYFELANKANRTERLILSQQLPGENLIIRINKKAYQINSPVPKAKPAKETKKADKSSTKSAPAKK